MNHPDTPDDTETENALRDAAGQADAPPTPAPAADDAAPPASSAADGGVPAPEPPTPPAPVPTAAEEDRREIARLREEITRTRAEVARLTQLTSLAGGSGAGSPPAPARSFDDLSEREMEVELRRQARSLDSF